jgi:hypothetical protein
VVEFGYWCPDVCRVVGVVTDLPGIQDREARPQMYVPAAGPDELPLYFYLHVRDREAVETLRSQMVREIHRIDPYIPVLSVTTLAEIRDDDIRVWYAIQARCIAAGLVAVSARQHLRSRAIWSLRTSEIKYPHGQGPRARHHGMILRTGATVVRLLAGLLLGLAVAR